MVIKMIEVHLPDYNFNRKLDYSKLGKTVDKIIEKNFPDGKYILRAIGSVDHPHLTLDKLADIPPTQELSPAVILKAPEATA